MFIVCIAVIIVVDQLTKQYVQATMLPGMSFPVVSDIFSITYVQNAGAAFGILENQRMFFIIATMLIVFGGIYLYPKVNKQAFLLRLGAALLMGGAVGNLIDRINLGVVVDFFDFHFWPVFNIADIAIVVGVAIIIYHILTKGLPE